MPLQRSDYHEAARYLAYACELLEREAFGRNMAAREVMQLAIRRLSPGAHFVGDAAAEISLLRHIGVPVLPARTEILKAVAVLHDQRGGNDMPRLGLGLW